MCDNVPTKAILFFFGCSEVNSTWLITSELANSLVWYSWIGLHVTSSFYKIQNIKSHQSYYLHQASEGLKLYLWTTFQLKNMFRLKTGTFWISEFGGGWRKARKGFVKNPERDTPLYGLYSYVRTQREWFFNRFCHKYGIDFRWAWSSVGYVCILALI